MLRWVWVMVDLGTCPAGSTPARNFSQKVSRFSFWLAGGPKRRETSATRPGALLGRVFSKEQSHGHTITADNRQDARA
jgi:hypothetical protein